MTIVHVIVVRFLWIELPRVARLFAPRGSISLAPLGIGVAVAMR